MVGDGWVAPVVCSGVAGAVVVPALSVIAGGGSTVLSGVGVVSVVVLSLVAVDSAPAEPSVADSLVADSSVPELLSASTGPELSVPVSSVLESLPLELSSLELSEDESVVLPVDGHVIPQVCPSRISPCSGVLG